MSSSKCLFSVGYFILKTTSEQLQLEIIPYKHSSQNLIMIIISLNLQLYLGLLLTNKCAVFCKLFVIQYDPKSLYNSEIQKLNVLSGSVTELIQNL